MSTPQNNPKIPDACPICDVLLKSLDRSAFDYYKTCSDCSMNFIQPNKAAWDDGWRPNFKQIVARLKKRSKEPFFYRNDKYI